MIATTAAASILAAAVAVLGVVSAIVLLWMIARRLFGRRKRGLSRLEGRIDAEYAAARQAMNDAAGQSWRNLID